VGALSAALEADGWRVVTAGPAGVLEGIRPIDVVVPIPTSVQPDGLLRAARRLRRALARDEGVSVVHAHGLKAGWLAVVSGRGRRRRPPVVVTVHNLILDETSGRAARIMRVLERAVFRVPASRRAGRRVAGGRRVRPAAHEASRAGDPARRSRAGGRPARGRGP
jgi:hypothetical protein